MFFFVLGKASLAGLFGQRFSINEVKLLEVEEDTYYHLPHLYEKEMIVNGTPIELNIFDLTGTTDPRAVKSRLNIYPLAVRLNIFQSAVFLKIVVDCCFDLGPLIYRTERQCHQHSTLQV